MSALITNEMVDLAAREARAWGVVSKHGEWTNEETQQQCARDILEAVAPLIAAKALRDAAEACTVTVPDETYTVTIRAGLGHKVRVVFTEDLMSRADAIEQADR